VGKKTIILGVIGADCHAVGNKILDFIFSSAGFDVINIGVLSTQEDFINAAIETDAQAILVSSLYGHGEIDCRGFREKCQETGLDNIILYVGGNLVVGKHEWTDVEKKFLQMGFNRVYPPGCNANDAVKDLEHDLLIRGKSKWRVI